MHARHENQGAAVYVQCYRLRSDCNTRALKCFAAIVKRPISTYMSAAFIRQAKASAHDTSKSLSFTWELKYMKIMLGGYVMKP